MTNRKLGGLCMARAKADVLSRKSLEWALNNLKIGTEYSRNMNIIMKYKFFSRCIISKKQQQKTIKHRCSFFLFFGFLQMFSLCQE